MPSAIPVILSWLRSLPTSFSVEEITKDTELIDQGIIDSIAILDLITFLEEKFSFVLPLNEFVPENFRTAAAIAQLVSQLSGEPGVTHS